MEVIDVLEFIRNNGFMKITEGNTYEEEREFNSYFSLLTGAIKTDNEFVFVNKNGSYKFVITFNSLTRKFRGKLTNDFNSIFFFEFTLDDIYSKNYSISKYIEWLPDYLTTEINPEEVFKKVKEYIYLYM